MPTAGRRAPRILAAALSLAMVGCDFTPEPGFDSRRCVWHLRQIGELLADHSFDRPRTLRALPGARFLLQLEPDCVEDIDLDVFCCHLDPEAPRPNPRGALRCSYYGPDAETAEAYAAGKLTGPVILACCDRHKGGLLVVWTTGRTETLTGQHSPVGPGSPDPRLRHLVR